MKSEGEKEVNEPAGFFQETVYDEAYRRGPEKTTLLQENVQQLLEFTIKAIDKGPFQTRILDVGCGTGTILEKFAETCSCFGVDLSSSAVEKARKRGIKAYCHNIEKALPFSDRYFHIVTMSEVLEHVIHTDRLLGEIWRILDNDGYLILTIPNINSPISFIVQIVLDYPPINSARYKSIHVKDFTLRTIKEALSNNGFGILRTKGTAVYPSTNKFSRFMANVFPRLSESIILSCLKTPKQKVKDETSFTSLSEL